MIKRRGKMMFQSAKIWRRVFCSLVFSIICVIAVLISYRTNAEEVKDGNIFWKDDFNAFKSTADASAGWVLNGIAVESMKGELSLREIGPKDSGTMTRNIPFPGDGCIANARYLQVRINGIEDIENPLSLNGVEGFFYSGINTFDIRDFPKTDNKLKITLRLKGPAGDKPGGWVKIDWIRLVKTPYSGITIERDTDQNLLFRYYSKILLPEKSLPFQCFAAKDKLWLCQWSKGVMALTPRNGTPVYTLKIPAKELSVVSPRSKNAKTINARLVVSADVSSVLTRGFSVFQIPVTISMKIKPPKEKAKTPLTRQYRSLWEARTIGENLALGREFLFPVKPQYRLTKRDGKDEWNLTDGKLAKSLDDRIWFSADAVGWYNIKGPVNMLIDLGEIHPVGKIVVRILCGAEQGNLRGPDHLAVDVSKDGEHYYRTSSLTRLMPGEMEQCDWKRYYFLPENGKSFVYPFELTVDAETRYVGLTVKGATGAIFMDEFAIIKATSKEVGGSNFNACYAPVNKVGFTTDGIIFGPSKNELVISTNVNAPSVFQSNDLRQTAKRKAKVRWMVELPPEITVFKNSFYKSLYPMKETFTKNGEKRVRWTLKETKLVRERGFGPVYFQLKKGIVAPPKDAYAVFYTLSEGNKPNKTRVPIRFITIPKVQKLKRLHNSLAWMGLGHGVQWPEFFKAWECMGFNYVGCFPRYWKRGKDGMPFLNPERKKLLTEARRRGFKLIMNESPFHRMVKGHKSGSEIFSQTLGGKSKNACPSYRGKYYKKEIDRIMNNVRACEPDYVFWDVEIWYRGAREAAKCSRCKEGRKRSGKPMEKYLTDMGKELNRDLYMAVKNGIKPGTPMPVVGSYNRQALHPIYHLVGDFNKCYPDYWNLAMPSLYVVGRAKDVHDNIRGNYKQLGCKKLIPWLTAGCYGEFPSKNIEAMVLESLMNGAGGTTYYWFQNFDTPDDYYYHAKAYAAIAPYEDLVLDGELLELKGDNPDMIYSVIRDEGEMLILVGNYAKTKKTETRITLPFKKIDIVKDIRAGKELKKDTQLTLTVPPGDIQLIYVRACPQKAGF